MERPYQSLGYLLAGFTAFHQLSFLNCFVTVALSRLLEHGKNTLARLSAVTLKNKVPCLIVLTCTITTSIAACARVDFPQLIKNKPRLPETYIFSFLEMIALI